MGCSTEDKCGGGCHRLFLPISSVCNMQCNFCDRTGYCRSFTSSSKEVPALSAQQAMFYLDKMISKDPKIKSVNIGGPGEVLLEIDKLQEIVTSIHKKYPELSICIQTNGLLLAEYADRLSQMNIDNIILNVHALSKDIAEKMYSWVKVGKNIHRGSKAAEFIVKSQYDAMKVCFEKGLKARVHSLYVPCINDLNIVEIARKAAELNLDSFSCMELDGGKDDSSQLQVILKQCAKRIKIKYVEDTFDEDVKSDYSMLLEIASGPIDPIQKRPYFAVATLDGLNVNRHLGQAREFNIYSYKIDRCELVDVRTAPEPGSGDERWVQLASMLSDCVAIFVTDAGAKPIDVLRNNGLKVVRTEGNICNSISDMYRIVNLQQKKCTALDCSTCSGC